MFDLAILPALQQRAVSRMTNPQPLSAETIRIVGYHGEVSPSNAQRQSGKCLSSTHTGFPIAPARCASAVSTVITRSS